MWFSDILSVFRPDFEMVKEGRMFAFRREIIEKIPDNYEHPGYDLFIPCTL
jgi:hypothetical protein